MRRIPKRVAADFTVGEKVVVMHDIIAKVLRIEARYIETEEQEDTHKGKIGEEYNPLLWLVPISMLDGKRIKKTCYSLFNYYITNKTIDEVSFDASHCQKLDKKYFDKRIRGMENEIKKYRALKELLIDPETGMPKSE